jgi:hypothetical protein
MLRLTVSRPVCLGVNPSFGVRDQVLVTAKHLCVCKVGLPLWREDRSVVYNCCWSQQRSHSRSPSPTGLMTIFYCLRFEIHPVKARSLYLYPSGSESPRCIPRHWASFSSTPATRGDKRRINQQLNYWSSLFRPGTDYTENVSSINASSPVVLSLPGKQRVYRIVPCCFTAACLYGCFLAIGLHVTIYCNHEVRVLLC